VGEILRLSNELEVVEKAVFEVRGRTKYPQAAPVPRSSLLGVLHPRL